MAIKTYVNGAWADIADLQVPYNGARVPAKEAYIYRNGAWGKVWPVQVIYPIIATYAVHTNADTSNNTTYSAIKVSDSCIEMAVEYNYVTGMYKKVSFVIEAPSDAFDISFDYEFTSYIPGGTSPASYSIRIEECDSLTLMALHSASTTTNLLLSGTSIGAYLPSNQTSVSGTYSGKLTPTNKYIYFMGYMTPWDRNTKYNGCVYKLKLTNLYINDIPVAGDIVMGNTNILSLC